MNVLIIIDSIESSVSNKYATFDFNQKRDVTDLADLAVQDAADTGEGIDAEEHGPDDDNKPSKTSKTSPSQSSSAFPSKSSSKKGHSDKHSDSHSDNHPNKKKKPKHSSPKPPKAPKGK
jgi:hypothetical protein